MVPALKIYWIDSRQRLKTFQCKYLGIKDINIEHIHVKKWVTKRCVTTLLHGCSNIFMYYCLENCFVSTTDRLSTKQL